MSSKTHYHIQPGSLHRSGKASIETFASGDDYRVSLNYSIDKKGLMPIPGKYLAGNVEFNLPPIFQNETGYLILEEQKQMILPKMRISHLGRRDLYELKNAHVVEVELLNGKGKGEILYHPSIPGCGWSEIKLTFHLPIPLLENYTLNADLNKS